MSLVLIVAAAWVLVLAVPLLSRFLGRFVGWPIGIAMLVLLAMIISLRTSHDGVIREAVPWIPSLDVALRLRLDGLSFLFTLLILGIGALVLIYSSSYMRVARTGGFFTLMTMFAAAMLTLVMADDILVMFVAWEFTTLASYLLILRSSAEAGPPATRTLLVTVAGGLCLLGAVAMMIAETGTTVLTDILADDVWSTDPTFTGVVAVLIALAAMTKSAQFPFHAWLPDAMVAPAPVSAYLHAAAMVKAGIFLLMLFAPVASNSPIWAPLLITVGLVTSVMGSIFATLKFDLKGLLAYSTVSQLGLMVAVIGIGTELAMLAVSVHVVAHAAFKASCFMAVGLIEKRAGTRDLRDLSGLWTVLRWDAVMLALAAASMAGIIPLLGFVSKELLLDALLHGPSDEVSALGVALALTAAFGAVFTVAYCARMVLPTLPGAPMEGVKPWSYAAGMSLAVTVTALIGVVVGPIVGILDPIVIPAAAVAANAPEAEMGHLALWHGVNLPFILSTLAILSGIGVAVALGKRDAKDAAAGRVREPYEFPVSGVGVVHSLQMGTIAFGRRVGDLTRYDSTAAHLALPLVVLGVLGVVFTPLLWRGVGEQSSATMLDVLLLMFMVAGVVATARSRTRLGAVIAVGVVGMAVVLSFFLLGASDVALTQLMVEVLTVAVMILVLRRMSWRFPQEPQGRRRLAAAVAVLAGLAGTGATLVFTGHREMSEVGRYFLQNVYEETGGTNVVNTILVDFRAFDTFGELVVLGICAVSIAALLDARRANVRPRATPVSHALRNPTANAVYLQGLGRIIIPVMAVASIYAFMRGHNAPGGGFIAALIGAAVLITVYLAATSDDVRSLRKPYLALAGTGMIVAAVTGFLGFFEGSFLKPLHADIFGYHFTTALVFDLGVYLAVLGVILAAVNRLGVTTADDGTGREPDEAELTPAERASQEIESTLVREAEEAKIAPAVLQDPDSPLYTGEMDLRDVARQLGREVPEELRPEGVDASSERSDR